MNTPLTMGFTRIDELKSRLDALRPLPEHTVRTLHEQQVLAWTYHSNAIEGNTLTLKETKVVLEGITIGGKRLREHLEVINHQDAIDYVEAIVAGREPLTEWQIRAIHQLVLKTIDPVNAGRYRRENVVIAGAEHVPPHFLQLPAAMAELIAWYEGAAALHPVARAAWLHVKFVGIHPFGDGNGRTARLLMNFELMRCGCLPVIIPVEKRLTYYETLDQAHVTRDGEPFIRMIAELEQATLLHYLHIIQSGSTEATGHDPNA